MRRLLLLLAALLLVALGGEARAQCALPYTFLNGTLADATQVNANFNAVVGCITGLQPTTGVSTAQYGMASTATAAANTTACIAASKAAYNLHQTLTFAGGQVKMNTGCEIYAGQRVDFAPDTYLVMQQDGPALGSRNAPGVALGATNADDVTFWRLQVDMNNHHGTAYTSRGGMHLVIHNMKFLHPLAGAWTDTGGSVTDTGTTTSGSTSITGLTTLVGRVGMKVTDSKGCIPANDQVATNNDAGNSLTLNTATGAGCGAGDTLTFSPVFPDMAITVEGIFNTQGSYYARIYNPDVRVTVDTSVSAYTSGSSFNVDTATGIVPMTANAITAASWAGKLATYTTTTAHGVAAGQVVCVAGMTPAAYNTCGIAARGTLGNTLVLVGITTNPGTATVMGTAYYGGSFVIDADQLAHLSAAQFVTALSGTTVTVSNPGGNGPRAGFGTGEAVSFTTGGVGIGFIGTGAHDNPNAGEVYGGKTMGFQVGQLNYQGNNILTKSADYTFSLYGVVLGGNGLGTGSTSVASQDTVEGLWAEYQIGDTAIWMTSDSTLSCAGGCGYNIASFSSPDQLASLEILDDGTNNRGQVNPLGWINQQSFTPTITCGAGAVGAYSIQQGRFSVLDKTVTLSVSVQAAIGTCSGTISVSLPPGASANGSLAQTLAGIDGTSVASGLVPLINTTTSMKLFTAAGGNPTGSDNFIISGAYQE